MKVVFHNSTVNTMNYLHGVKLLEINYGRNFNKSNISY